MSKNSIALMSSEMNEYGCSPLFYCLKENPAGDKACRVFLSRFECFETGSFSCSFFLHHANE